jgi:hypothetical protein
VLERNRDRSAIGSPAELRRASEDELAEHGDEIAAAVKRLLSLHREVRQSMLDKQLRCMPRSGDRSPAYEPVVLLDRLPSTRLSAAPEYIA